MSMPPRVRKFMLVAHVTTSVGWLGAVAAFLGLAAVGVTSQNPQTVRGVYMVMEPAAWYVLVPLAVGAVVIGVIQSLGSSWGLFRHYWVIFKLLIALVATILLLNYMSTFALLAETAASSDELSEIRSSSPMLHAVLALLGLLTAAVLSVYKPRGMTPYGQRKQRARQPSRRDHEDIPACEAGKSS